MVYEDKRTDTTDEFVPYTDSEAETDSEVVEEIEKRKLGDSLRLGKRSAFMDDGVPKFGRHARLFEQMRLGKRSESDKPRDKKKSTGKRLQLVPNDSYLCPMKPLIGIT